MGTQGSPKGIGVPYWPDAGEGGYDPDPLTHSEVPSSLTPFDEFIGGSGGVLKGGKSGAEMAIHFEPTPFDHPVFIMFSSGTTGLPKCMVHGAGGAPSVRTPRANPHSMDERVLPSVRDGSTTSSSTRPLRFAEFVS